MEYRRSWELEKRVRAAVERLGLDYVEGERIRCVKSSGSKSKRTIARLHAFPHVWKEALGMEAHYVIEFISERFEKLREEEKERVIVHELAHIPKTFSGGVLAHNRFFRKRVERLTEKEKREE